MGGRGQKTSKANAQSRAKLMDEISGLQKQLTSARALITRRERELASAKGGLRAFDWGGFRPNQNTGDMSKPYSPEKRERYEKAQDRVELARNKLNQAKDKADKISSQMAGTRAKLNDLEGRAYGANANEDVPF